MLTRACGLIGLALALCGCLAEPAAPAERALYLDLRKIVSNGEDHGWIIDSVRLRANLEYALHSVCRTEPAARAGLDAWLSAELLRQGGSARAIYFAHDRRLSAAAGALALERTRALLRYAQAHANECPFWLEPDPNFVGQQLDAARWVVFAESTGFASLVLRDWIPALGGGGRLLLGRGLDPFWTVAFGAQLAASGAFVTRGDHGFDATASLSTPLLVRFSRLSRMIDLTLAPVMRFGTQRRSWPPGARVELGVGWSGLRGEAFMDYTMLYVGYEVHFEAHSYSADHTLELGTRFGLDWAP